MESEVYVDFDPQLPRHKPLLYKFIIGIIIVMYIFELFFNALYSENTIIILGAKWNEGITRGEYWRFFTCTFLHGNLFHLFLNLSAIYIFGKEVESIYGSFKFLAFYLLTSWGASLTSYICSTTIAIGASGAVFGILGGLIVFFFKQRGKVSGANMRFKSMYTLVIINLIFGFLIPRIDNSAHIGGIITGLLTGWFISPEYRIEKDEANKRLFIVEKLEITKILSGLIFIITILFLLSKIAINNQLIISN